MSKRPILINSSDLHIEYNAYVTHPQMWGDSYFSFSQICNKALELNCPMSLSGDVFDKPIPDSYSLNYVFKWLDEFMRRELAVLFIQGQHELCRRQPWLSVHQWPIHMNDHRIPVPGSPHIEIAGIDFFPEDKLASRIKDLKPVDILLCHQVWGEFMGSICAPEGWLRSLVGRVKLVLTGDFHQHTQLVLTEKIEDAVQSMTVLSPGSMSMQSSNEEFKKHFYVVYDDFSYESIPLLTRETIRLAIFSEEGLQSILRQLETAFENIENRCIKHNYPENMRKPLIYVKFVDDLPDAYNRLKTVLSDRAFVMFKPVSAAQEVKRIATTAANLTDALKTLGLDESSHLYRLAQELLDSKTIKETVSDIVETLWEKYKNEIEKT